VGIGLSAGCQEKPAYLQVEGQVTGRLTQRTNHPRGDIKAQSENMVVEFAFLCPLRASAVKGLLVFSLFLFIVLLY